MMTRKDFNILATLMVTMSYTMDRSTYAALMLSMVDACRESNEHFDELRFYRTLITKGDRWTADILRMDASRVDTKSIYLR